MLRRQRLVTTGTHPAQVYSLVHMLNRNTHRALSLPQPHPTQLMSVPVYTLKMQDLVQYYKDRMRRAECGLDGTISYVNGQPKELTLSAKCGKVTAKVTRAAGVKVRYDDDSTEELYGTDLTRDVVIRRNHPVTIPLRPEDHHSVAPHTTFSLPYPPMEREANQEAGSR